MGAILAAEMCRPAVQNGTSQSIGGKALPPNAAASAERGRLSVRGPGPAAPVHGEALAAHAWSPRAVQALRIAYGETLDNDEAATCLARVEAKLIAPYQHRREKDGVLEGDLC
jgi:hypothetical protein